MRARRLHRLVGIVMLLPFVGWAATGFIFFIKPGYGAAYEALAVRTYPLDATLTIAADPSWREVRVLRTVLGGHLLARTDDGWLHLDPVTRQPRPAPDDEALRRLIADAFTAHAARYGEIIDSDRTEVTTSTGARVRLDWPRLSLQQRGRDTDRIDLLYRIHYLQWTGSAVVDRVLGFAGLLLVVTLTVLGARLAFGRARRSH